MRLELFTAPCAPVKQGPAERLNAPLKNLQKKIENLLTSDPIRVLSRPPREAARERQLKGRSRRKSGRLFRPHERKLFNSVGPALLRTPTEGPRASAPGPPNGTESWDGKIKLNCVLRVGRADAQGREVSRPPGRSILAIALNSDQANQNFYGEFDSGSERTLAAWIRHASRTRSLDSLLTGVTVADGCVTREQPALKWGIALRKEN